jgi:hypothetical protein
MQRASQCRTIFQGVTVDNLSLQAITTETPLHRPKAVILRNNAGAPILIEDNLNRIHPEPLRF